MDIKNMKVMVGIIVAIVAQAFGMIWYIAQLDSTVTNNTTAIESIEEFDSTELWEALDNITETGYIISIIMLSTFVLPQACNLLRFSCCFLLLLRSC